MEGHAVEPSERSPGFKEYLARWKPKIHPVKSAEEEFQEKLKEYRDLFDSLTDSSQKFNRMPEILDCGGRITQLENTKQDKEHEYQQNLCDQQEALLYESFGLVDLEFIQEVFNNWCHGRGQPLPTTPTQSSTGIPGIIDIGQPQDTTTSRFTPITDQPTRTRNSMPSPPNSENARETSTRPSEADRTENNTSAGPQKRPANPVVARQPKRPRPDVALGPLTGDRTIEYDQVYQNGKAEPKYNIAWFDGFYYILECKEHRMHFHKDPMRGAAKHLRGRKHNQEDVDYKEAIRALGIRVLNCDEKKFKANNDVDQRPICSQIGRPLTSLSPSTGRDIPTRSTQSLATIDPKPGEVYTTFWSGTKEFFAILVLPWINAGQLGKDFSLTVQDTKLIDEVPTCYRYNQADGSFEWAPGYLPGGQHYSKRKYPIMYFDAPVFPGQCRLNWIPACEFNLYDPKVPTIQFKDIVDGFIASRDDGIQESGEWWPIARRMSFPCHVYTFSQAYHFLPFHRTFYFFPGPNIRFWLSIKWTLPFLFPSFHHKQQPQTVTMSKATTIFVWCLFAFCALLIACVFSLQILMPWYNTRKIEETPLPTHQQPKSFRENIPQTPERSSS